MRVEMSEKNHGSRTCCGGGALMCSTLDALEVTA